MARKKDLQEENKKEIPLKQKKRELSVIFGVIIIIILLFIIFMLVNQKSISTVGKVVETTHDFVSKNCNLNGDNSECGSTAYCVGGTCQDQSELACICSEKGYSQQVDCSTALDLAEEDAKAKLEVSSCKTICGDGCSPPRLKDSSTTVNEKTCEATATMSIGCNG